MSYKVIISEQKDKYILSYPSGDQFGGFIVEEFPKTHTPIELGIAIATKMRLNTLVKDEQ